MTIHDGRDNLIGELIHERLPGGSYMVRWDGTDSHGEEVASGVYFYRVRIGSTHESGTIELMR